MSLVLLGICKAHLEVLCVGQRKCESSQILLALPYYELRILGKGEENPDALRKGTCIKIQIVFFSCTQLFA